MHSAPPAAAPDADRLLPLLRDLGAEPTEIAGPGGDAVRWRLVTVQAGSSAGAAELADAALEARGALLVLVAGGPNDRELARWRDELWPRFHVVALYRLGGGRARRETLQGTELLPGETPLEGVVLLARRRADVMAPEAIVEKFDHNAAGWDGTPGGPGYPHFRWMRRHVALFAAAPPRARILDFGCGAGWVGIEAALRCPESTLCFFDPSPEMVRIAEANAVRAGLARIEGRTGFGEAPPFPRAGEEPFDLVLSSGVVSFAPELEPWLDGLARTVRAGGTLVVGDIHRDSFGFRRRRRAKPLLPVRELNARTRVEVRQGLEARGFRHLASGGYQATWPVPQAMHLSETRLKGALTWPLLGLNRAAAALDRVSGSRLQAGFDSWVMALVRDGARA